MQASRRGAPTSSTFFDRVGLCQSCRWMRRVTTSRGSVFYLCRRAETDARYSRYPALPRLACAGYEPGPPDSASGQDGEDVAPGDSRGAEPR
jgi:hypothetical protein